MQVISLSLLKHYALLECVNFVKAQNLSCKGHFLVTSAVGDVIYSEPVGKLDHRFLTDTSIFALFWMTTPAVSLLDSLKGGATFPSHFYNWENV